MRNIFISSENLEGIYLLLIMSTPSEPETRIPTYRDNFKEIMMELVRREKTYRDN